MKKVQFLRMLKVHPKNLNSKGKSSGLTTNMYAKIKKRNDPVSARKFVTWGIIISSFMVGISLFVTIYYNPEAVAKRKFEELAKIYYEDYYYERFMESIEDSIKAEKMKMYEETGFQPVLLRQLLLYQNGKYSDYKKYFEQDGFTCDKNKMSVKFFPVAPYGKTDYTVEYNMSCTNE